MAEPKTTPEGNAKADAANDDAHRGRERTHDRIVTKCGEGDGADGARDHELK
jgi:hypothetical protein